MTFLSVGVRCGAQWNEGKNPALPLYANHLVEQSFKRKRKVYVQSVVIYHFHMAFPLSIPNKSYCIASIALLKFFGKHPYSTQFSLVHPNALEQDAYVGHYHPNKVIINVRVFMILYLSI